MVTSTWREPPALIPLEVKEVVRNGSKLQPCPLLSFHIRFGQHGWATFYIDDYCGTLAVVSDWGAWAYRWGRSKAGLGIDPPDLSVCLYKRFRNDAHYVAKKLMSDVKDGYDAEATEREVRSRILDLRRQQRCTREQAKEAWDYLDSVAWHDGPHAVADELCSDELREFTGDEYYEYIEYSPPHAYYVLREQLLPAFFDALGAHLKECSL